MNINYIETMKQALTAVLNSTEYRLGHPGYEHTAANLRAAIDATEKQEPVAYAVINGDRVAQLSVTQDPFYPHSAPLYTHPEPTQSDTAQAKDAARYRWLKDGRRSKNLCVWETGSMLRHDRMLSGKALDKAIDKAMKARAGGTA